MKTDGSALLRHELKVPASDVRWLFIADFYDGPISGLVVFRGKIYSFCCFPEDIPGQSIYVLHALSEAELFEKLADKEQFEQLVGTHGSFDQDGARKPYVLRSKESQKKYYAEQRVQYSTDPNAKPVEVWFDTSDK